MVLWLDCKRSAICLSSFFTIINSSVAGGELEGCAAETNPIVEFWKHSAERFKPQRGVWGACYSAELTVGLTFDGCMMLRHHGRIRGFIPNAAINLN